MSANTTPVDLRWIENDEPTDTFESEFSRIEPSGTFNNRFFRKCRENLLVPLGLLATTLCVVVGISKIGTKQIETQQALMRGRVGFQAATIFFMACAMYESKAKAKKNRPAQVGPPSPK